MIRFPLSVDRFVAPTISEETTAELIGRVLQYRNKHSFGHERTCEHHIKVSL